MKLIMFTRNGYKVPQPPPGLEFQHIKFESTKLVDLLDIAQYRVVNFPTAILLNDKGKMVLRTKGMPSKTLLKQATQDQ